MTEYKLSSEQIENFRRSLILEERSGATVNKYLHDVRVFVNYIRGKTITKDLVIEYKKYLQDNYAIRSVNSMIASLNSLFVSLGWYEIENKNVEVATANLLPGRKRTYQRRIQATVRCGKVKQKSKAKSNYTNHMQYRNKGKRVTVYNRGVGKQRRGGRKLQSQNTNGIYNT